MPTYHKVSDNTENDENISADPVWVDGWYITNTSGFMRYVRLFNQATGPNTAVAPLLTLGITSEGAANVSLDSPLDFDAGLGINMTAQIGDGTTDPVDDEDLVVNIYYSEPEE